MRIIDWSSDVFSSDLVEFRVAGLGRMFHQIHQLDQTGTALGEIFLLSIARQHVVVTTAKADTPIGRRDLAADVEMGDVDQALIRGVGRKRHVKTANTWL